MNDIGYFFMPGSVDEGLNRRDHQHFIFCWNAYEAS